ncbi:hypothetical protein E2C01_019245 [Portunus trituberculatus]|uniref:Uncharacterized protein n=1 Tax=Portunus trituberculatus TaxID=210409 RepID=A0A5B7DYW9_PORTR|nr:hypothetical protein [Portunus trituberculatus]
MLRLAGLPQPLVVLLIFTSLLTEEGSSRTAYHYQTIRMSLCPREWNPLEEEADNTDEEEIRVGCLATFPELPSLSSLLVSGSTRCQPSITCRLSLTLEGRQMLTKL